MRVRFVNALLVLAACGGEQVPVHYAAAIPVPKPAPEPTVDLSDVSAPWKRNPMAAVDNDVLRPTLIKGELNLGAKPGAKATEPAPPVPEPVPVDGHSVIRTARVNSYLEPDETNPSALEGSEYVYEYAKGKTYAVYACARMALRFELAQNERIIGTPVIDDNSGRRKKKATEQGGQAEVVDYGWAIPEPIDAGDGSGNVVQHIYMRPNYEGVGKQYMHFLTNIGPYRVRLEVLKNDDPDCMTAVRWRHPHLEQMRLQRIAAAKKAQEEAEEEQASEDNAANLEPFTCSDADVNRDYEVIVHQGNPSWVPTVCHKVRGDHARVHIEFPQHVAWTQTPVLMKDGSPSDCQTLRQEREIRCDNLASRYVLKLGARGREEVIYVQRVMR